MIQIPVSHLRSFRNRDQLTNVVGAGNYLTVARDGRTTIKPITSGLPDEFLITVSGTPLVGCPVRPIEVDFNPESDTLTILSEE